MYPAPGIFDWFMSAAAVIGLVIYERNTRREARNRQESAAANIARFHRITEQGQIGA